VIFKRLLSLFKKAKPVELRLVMYSEADKLLTDGWRIATRYEDRNQCIGMVYLERDIKE
jgi:hypothetical protein